jgi:ABC-2 type transport system ATP-binding protein
VPAELSRNGDGPPDAIHGEGVGIHLRGVGKRFGEIVALRGIDFEIPRHSRIGIVGPSGCCISWPG